MNYYDELKQGLLSDQYGGKLEPFVNEKYVFL
jgi:hypothetical protein